MKHKLKSGSKFEIVNSNESSILSVSEAGSVTIAGTEVATQSALDLKADKTELPTAKYRHNIQIILDDTYLATFSLITNSSPAIVSLAALRAALLTNSFSSESTVCPAQGQCYTSDYTRLVVGIYGSGDDAAPSITFKYLTIAYTSGSTMTVYQKPVAGTTTYSTTPSIIDVVEEC